MSNETMGVILVLVGGVVFLASVGALMAYLASRG